jgi:hypothetical protein
MERTLDDNTNTHYTCLQTIFTAFLRRSVRHGGTLTKYTRVFLDQTLVTVISREVPSSIGSSDTNVCGTIFFFDAGIFGRRSDSCHIYHLRSSSLAMMILGLY